MKKMTLDTTLAIADDLLSGERGVQIIQHLEIKAAAGDQDAWIRALFAGVYEAIRIGIEAGIEHGTELTCDRIAAVRPSEN
jgi:hypothetical protein